MHLSTSHFVERAGYINQSVVLPHSLAVNSILSLCGESSCSEIGIAENTIRVCIGGFILGSST